MGTGRASGFYRQLERKANPEAAKEYKDEAEREERRRRCREAKAQAEQEERRREREEYRGENREENGGEENLDKDKYQERQRGQPGGQERQPAARRWREDHEDQRSKSWAEYDEAFTLFWDGCTRTHTVSVRDIPLPPAGHAPIAPSSNPEEWHRSVRKAELRWHPDKWAKVLRMLDGDEAQQTKLKQLCEKMFRAVVMCKDKGFRKQAAMAGL